MEKEILFYSDKCPDCPPFQMVLDSKGIDYEAVNITESIPNLKRFLQLRDTRCEFADIKARGSIGIPTLLTTNNQIIFKQEDL